MSIADKRGISDLYFFNEHSNFFFAFAALSASESLWCNCVKEVKSDF